MRSIETLATLSADGTLTAKISTDIPPGDHQVIIVIDERSPLRIHGFVADEISKRGRIEENDHHQVEVREPLRFSAYQVGLISDDFTFRREDLYDDDI
jgi:hypothetical protein